MLHPKLLAKLVELRNTLERPVYITSGYRCPKYNQKVGGVVSSYHCIGLAADITVKDMELISPDFRTFSLIQNQNSIK